MKLKYFTAATAIVLCVACKKADTFKQPEELPAPVFNTAKAEGFKDGLFTVEDIYLAGYRLDEGLNKFIPTYWKNSTPVAVAIPTYFSEANSIVVAGNNDIYVGGWYRTSANDPGPWHRVWKNGWPLQVSITSGSANIITAIAVSNGNVHAVGYNNVLGSPNEFRYWVNGVPDFFVAHGAPGDVKVYGPDVYITAGNKLWKNKVPQWIDYGGAINTRISAVAVDNANILHAAGMQNTATTTASSAVYWRNGVRTILPVITTGGNFYASAEDVAVSGTSVYIAGTYSGRESEKKVLLWKNGTPIEITDGTTYSAAEAIAVSANNQVYIAGYENQPGNVSIAKLWKYDVATGVITSVTLNGSYKAKAYDIFIKPVKIIADPPPGGF